ncbi:MAG: hypothetical protein NC335_05225 [Bacteroides sp.]|nr:hypothetical protein [Bacteroides sp.]
MKRLFVVFCVFWALSCSQEKNEDFHQSTEDFLRADLIELAAQNSEVIDYRIARCLAYEELEGGAKEFLGLDSEDYTISQIPRVTYDSDNLPEFYEFDVICEGHAAHTIVTIAKKEDSVVIVDLLEGTCGTIATKSPQEREDVICEWEDYEMLLGEMDDESREMTKMSIEELKTYNELMVDDIDEKELADYWDSIDVRFCDLTKDEQIDLRKIETKGKGIQPNEGDLYSGNPTSYVYIIPKYNTNLKATRWSGECGPGAVAWMYRGLYNSYPRNSGAYIPIFGDSYSVASSTFFQNSTYAYFRADESLIQSDNGLFLQAKTHTHSLGEMYEAGLKNAVSEITGGQYKVSTTAYSHKHIEKGEPVFIMAVMDGSAHYFVAFGYGYTKKGAKKTKYILIADNGSMTVNNTYRKYNAYWRKETSNYGLRYKVTLK